METDPQTLQTTPGGEAQNTPEARQVEDWFRSIEHAREHDRPARAKYAIDRRYAAGTADQSLAVQTNLIGNMIDILVDYLYAKDPDVSCMPAEEVQSAMPDLPIPPPPAPPPMPDGTGDPAALEQYAGQQQVFAQLELERQMRALARRKTRAERMDFAATLQIVISKLWKRGRLKKAVRKQVRSCLSIGPGWIKAIMLSEDVVKNPEVKAAVNDLRDNLARIAARRRELMEQVPDDLELAEKELNDQIAALEAKVEVVVRKAFVVDFVPAENITISTDVAYIDDYLEAGWISNRIFIRKSELLAKFPQLTTADVQAATSYYMRSPRDTISPQSSVDVLRLEFGAEDATAADLFVSEKGASSPSAFPGADHHAEAFARVEEIWDRESNLIRTAIEGVKRWAKPAFTPQYPTSRFYPFFYLAFYEIDGSRHPQSMSSRLAMLQDEYNQTRSSLRLTRRRSIPGVIFNKKQVDPENAKEIEQAVEQEYIGVDPVNPNTTLKDLFAPKPVVQIDPALFDTTPIVRDMEKLSGVQEAKQSSATRRPNMTATEAQIEEAGFAERTNADRDAIDDMLTELAIYTAESALSCLTYEEVKRMAGVDAFWPEGLPIEELTDIVSVDIEAGSTGRPNRREEREAWAVLLPLIRQDIVAIQQARATGNEPLAKALIELLKETWKRSGGRGDIERFIPETPMAPPMIGAPAPSLGPPGADPNLAADSGSELDGPAGAPRPSNIVTAARVA